MTRAVDSEDRAAEVAELLGRIAALLAPAPALDQAAPLPSAGRVLLTVEEAARRLGVGRTMMYSLIGRGEVCTVHIGRLRRVPASEVDAYAARLVAST